MPFFEVPARSYLRMFIAINILPGDKDDPDLMIPLDPLKPNLVFIHAPTSSSWSFAAQFSDPRLSRAFNLIAPDARLHGRTTGGDRPSHRVEDSADCLIAALDKLRLKEYSVVGEGFHGACVAAWMGIKRPEKVGAICLVSPGHLKEPEASVSAMMTEFLPSAIVNKDGNGDQTGTIPYDSLAMMNDYFFGDCERQEERRKIYLDRFQHRYGTNHGSHDITRLIEFFQRDPIPSSLLAGIKAHILILRGESDQVASPKKAAEEWRDSLKSAKGGVEIQVIKGAPHLLTFTDFSVANRILFLFFSRYATVK